jgi:hypothetical protein
MAVQIERDPFARMTLMRELLPIGERKECTWCGQPAKFTYAWEEDSRARRGMPLQDKPFCSVSCFKTYYE